MTIPANDPGHIKAFCNDRHCGYIGQTVAFAIVCCNLPFFWPSLLWSPVASVFLCAFVTSGGFLQCSLAASSQMANDLPQWLWLHGSKQIPLGRSLATSQTWNLSGTQLDGYHKVVRFFHGMGFSFLGAWLPFTKQFLAFLGTLWCC